MRECPSEGHSTVYRETTRKGCRLPRPQPPPNSGGYLMGLPARGRRCCRRQGPVMKALAAKISVFLVTSCAPLTPVQAQSACVKVRPAPAGSVAPCSGLLVPAATALRDARCTDADLPQCRSELRWCQQSAKVADKSCGAHMDALRSELHGCRSREPDVVTIKPPLAWWQRGRTVALLAGLGAAAGFTIGYCAASGSCW